MICIAILNWNGYEDTVECLDSLYGSTFDDFFIVLGDNGSEDGSTDRLQDCCAAKGRSCHRIRLGEESYPSVSKRDIILYDLKENNGFSKANNMMVRFASHYRPEGYLLLNNDTAVEPDFLKVLAEFRQSHPEFGITTPLIRYFKDRDIVWNAGGRIRWGFRKYLYRNMKASQVREKDYMECSFVTGCCMFFSPGILTEDSRIFTEKFFYGEEDFELALRMKRRKVRMACVTGSVIYHKVSASVSRHPSRIGPVYIHYLNRLIDVRDYMSPISYPFYAAILCAGIAMYLRKAFRMSPKEIFRFIKILHRHAGAMESVPKEYCLKIFRDGIGSADLFLAHPLLFQR